MSEVEIRPATGADLPRIREIVEAAYCHYIPRIGRRPRPMDDDYETLVAEGSVQVAEQDGAAAGILVLGSDENDFFIANVAVDPPAQGTGVGRALLVHAEERARAAGFDSVLLWTHELMSENRRLYERSGYGVEPPAPSPEDPRVFLRKPLG